MIYDKGDYCLRASMYSSSILLNSFRIERIKNAYKVMEDMKSECRLNNFFGHRKSKEYRWSNSGSENPKENTPFKRPSFWIYWNILVPFYLLTGIHINPFKGLNGDQYRAYFLWVFLTKDWKAASKVMLGFVFRLGFTPSLMEWAPLKLQAYVLLLKTPFPLGLNYIWYPVYLVALFLFKVSYKRELNIPIEESTTNKIAMLPTAFILDQKLPEEQYIKDVYYTYWSNTHEIGGIAIRENMIEALSWEK